MIPEYTWIRGSNDVMNNAYDNQIGMSKTINEFYGLSVFPLKQPSLIMKGGYNGCWVSIVDADGLVL